MRAPSQKPQTHSPGCLQWDFTATSKQPLCLPQHLNSLGGGVGTRLTCTSLKPGAPPAMTTEAITAIQVLCRDVSSQVVLPGDHAPPAATTFPPTSCFVPLAFSCHRHAAPSKALFLRERQPRTNCSQDYRQWESNLYPTETIVHVHNKRMTLFRKYIFPPHPTRVTTTGGKYRKL